jgi:hypothetical protein
MKTEILKADVVTVDFWTIPKGTRIIIIKEFTLKNPKGDLETWRKVKIDNGTPEELNLFPENAYKVV